MVDASLVPPCPHEMCGQSFWGQAQATEVVPLHVLEGGSETEGDIFRSRYFLFLKISPFW